MLGQDIILRKLYGGPSPRLRVTSQGAGARARAVASCGAVLGRCPGVQSHVQHPAGDAWPEDAGLVMDMTPDLPPDGSTVVSDNEAVDGSGSEVWAALPIDGAAWTSG